MRAVVQRVNEAKVTVNKKTTGEIKKGILVFLGVENGDLDRDADYMVDKILGLRIFEDEMGKMNLSVKDVQGEVLVVSQFTLLGDCRTGKRPSFIEAARPEQAKTLYDYWVEKVRQQGIDAKEGVFQAEMLVTLANDGPVTILIDSKKTF